MNAQTTVQALLESTQQGTFENARPLLAENFRFSGSVPTALDAKAWLSMSASLKAAFPDLEYHFQMTRVEPQVVHLTAQLSGTHTGDFDLTSMLDMGIIPATYKSFATVLQKARLRVVGGQVTDWRFEPTTGAGLLAILQQLDIYITDVIVVDRQSWSRPFTLTSE